MCYFLMYNIEDLLNLYCSVLETPSNRMGRIVHDYATIQHVHVLVEPLGWQSRPCTRKGTDDPVAHHESRSQPKTVNATVQPYFSVSA